MTLRAAIGVALLATFAAHAAGDSAIAPSEGDATGPQLDAIRQQLVALDIENALERLNTILDRSDLPDAVRVTALDLRAQADVARDDLDAAEKDYRALLELQPGYAPSRDVTSKKAMERFLKLRMTMVGTVRVDMDPKDALLTLDGRPVSISAEGVVPVVSGDRQLHFTRKGFDALDVDLRAPAGQETPVKVRMIPNARSVVVRTDVGGVSVTVDGVDSGVTARADGAGVDASSPATLLLEDVGIGGHEFRFSKSCFATESLEELVSVDLADRTPKLLKVVAMRPSRARVTATGATYDGELLVDGERAADLPLTSFTICPGRRSFEVVASGRVVWSGVREVEESDVTVDLTPRPNAFLVGSEWPAAWGTITASWNLRGRVDPPAGADLTTPDGWSKVPVPAGTDLAVAVIPGAGVAGDERVILFSPALREVEERASPPRLGGPNWRVATIGAVLVDAGQGSVVVASTSATGPAARAGLVPGDRLLAIGGRAVTGASSAREAVAALGLATSVELDVAPPAGAPRKVSCATVGIPETRWSSGSDTNRVLLAAWAAVDAAAGGPDAPVALAQLAMLLERSGRQGAALDAWRRVRVLGSGRLSARAAYAIGEGLETAGKRVEAIEAFSQARTEGLANADPALAAAAGDRLADLGVTPR